MKKVNVLSLPGKSIHFIRKGCPLSLKQQEMVIQLLLCFENSPVTLRICQGHYTAGSSWPGSMELITTLVCVLLISRQIRNVPFTADFRERKSWVLSRLIFYEPMAETFSVNGSRVRTKADRPTQPVSEESGSLSGSEDRREAFSILLAGIYALGKDHIRSTTSLRGFPNVAFETVLIFV